MVCEAGSAPWRRPPRACKCSGMFWSGLVRVRFFFCFRSGFSPPVRVLFPVQSGPVRVSFSRLFVYKRSFPLELCIGSVLELLVLENAAQRTSQRLRRPSGARVRTCSRSLGRLVSRSLDRSLDRSIVQSLARSLACSTLNGR